MSWEDNMIHTQTTSLYDDINFAILCSQKINNDGLYFHSFRYIGAVPLLFLHAEADEEIEGKGPGEVSATVGRHS